MSADSTVSAELEGRIDRMFDELERRMAALRAAYPDVNAAPHRVRLLVEEAYSWVQMAERYFALKDGEGFDRASAALKFALGCHEYIARELAS